MNTRKMLAVGCVAMFSIVAVAQSAEPTAAPAPVRAALSQTSEASCLIKVTCDPTVLPLNRDIVEMLLKSAGVGNEAFRNVFGSEDFAFTLRFGRLTAAAEPGTGVAPPAETPLDGMSPGMGGMGMMGSGGGGMMAGAGYGMPARTPIGDASYRLGTNSVVGQLAVTVDLLEGAEEFMAAVCDRLETALINAHNAEEEQARRRVEAADHEVELARTRLDELQKMRRAYSTEAGQQDLAREAVLDRDRALTQELQELEMRMAGERARREAIEKQIAESGARATQETEQDLMAKALEQKLKANREQLENLRKLAAAGRVPHQEVAEAETQAVMIQAELAERRSAAAREAGGERLNRLNAELAELSISSAECEARLRVAREKAERMKELLTKADEYERSVLWELPLVRQAYEQARVRQEELARWLRTLQPPSVTVIGGR
ncbi:MAG: hypothetical protein JXA69_06055 [Phycisphaerae bacterium]|nr:hypothetical protein [Phycisphaerae bacterium]